MSASGKITALGSHPTDIWFVGHGACYARWQPRKAALYWGSTMKLLKILVICACGMVAACSAPSDDAGQIAPASPAAAVEPSTIFGDAQEIGQGSIRPYVRVSAEGAPSEVGVHFPMSALQGLPTEKNTTSRCWDMNGDGEMTADECDGDTEWRLPVPGVDGGSTAPYRWVGVNFNPQGHMPPNWGVPHFDFHFYLVSEAAIDAIRTGPCEMMMNCDDLETGKIPVAEQYVAPNYISIGAVVPAMGNHLVDSTSTQMGPPFDPATHVMIYGSYGGEVTFIEPMVTLDYLNGKPNECFPVAQPAAVQSSGHYPKQYCFRYDAEDDSMVVSLTDLEFREAS
jgi:hypothetical protein